MVKSVSSSRDSGSPMEVERAHRACEKCTRTKKKCDKALPACSRCTRLTTTCCYDFVYTAPATAVVDPGYLLNSKGSEYTRSSVSAPTYSIFDPNFEVSSSMVMTLLSSRNINWRESTERYFETMNPWLSIVHPELLVHKTKDLGPNDNPTNPHIALLMVSMQLVTQYRQSADPVNMEEKEMMIKLPAYFAAKRILSLLRGLSEPSIELIQCTVLLGLYEFGHGDVRRAYVTIGDANTMINAMGIRPGKYIEAEKDAQVAYEDEERRCVYWGLFVLDRLIHVDCNLTNMPLHVTHPAPDDLLPTTNLVWTKDSQTPTTTVQRHPASVSPSVPVGPFQRNCQCAILYTQALSGWSNVPLDDFSELDVATRALVEAMVWQASRWGDFYECFATCTCLLIYIYCRYLRTIDSNNIHPATSDVNALKAIAGLNFTVRIIADTTTDLNDQFARRPQLLAPSSPVTPYSAYHCLMVLSNFEHVIPEADVRFHAIYSSLHFFAKRWGVAVQLVGRMDSYLASDGATSDTPWCFLTD
ncbi:Fc.00g100860.m01.CDS01 [Cosmosporella sp. VM-42]